MYRAPSDRPRPYILFFHPMCIKLNKSRSAFVQHRLLTLPQKRKVTIPVVTAVSTVWRQQIKFPPRTRCLKHGYEHSSCEMIQSYLMQRSMFNHIKAYDPCATLWPKVDHCMFILVRKFANLHQLILFLKLIDLLHFLFIDDRICVRCQTSTGYESRPG